MHLDCHARQRQLMQMPQEDGWPDAWPHGRDQRGPSLER